MSTSSCSLTSGRTQRHPVGKMHLKSLMILSPNMQEVALQAEPDVREFRQLFDVYSVASGSAKDLSSFVRQLRDDPDFAIDFWGLTRSLRLKEKGYLTDEELFTLIVIAAAGPDFSPSNAQIADLLSELHNLLAVWSEAPPAKEKSRRDALAPMPEKPDGKASHAGGQSSRRPTAEAGPQPYKGGYVALAAVLLSGTMIFVGSGMVYRHSSMGAGGFVVASGSERIADESVRNLDHAIGDSIAHPPSAFSPGGSIQAHSSAPAILATGSTTRGSGESRSLRKVSLQAFGTDSVAEAHRSGGKTPIRLVERNSNFSSKAPFMSYGLGKSRRVTLSSGVMAANLLESHPPSYPRLASMARVQGPVVLQAIVSGRGTVESVHVIKGPHLLRGAASDALLKWRFRPYLANGKPAEVATIVTIDFALEAK
jgi:TonB family protein